MITTVRVGLLRSLPEYGNVSVHYETPVPPGVLVPRVMTEAYKRLTEWLDLVEEAERVRRKVVYLRGNVESLKRSIAQPGERLEGYDPAPMQAELADEEKKLEEAVEYGKSILRKMERIGVEEVSTT